MDSKLCLECGRRFYRPLVYYSNENKNYPLSITLWKKRRYCSNHCSAKNKPHPIGKDHHEWKGINASYSAIHRYIKRQLGIPEKCEHCDKNNKSLVDGRRSIHWANIDHKYKRNIGDWIALCAMCHGAYDKELGLRKR